MAMDKQTWTEFRKTGLLKFVNLFLHIFGWCIVVVESSITHDFIEAYPARCNFNGFSKEDEKGFLKLRRFMRNDEHLFKLNCGETDNGNG